MGAIWTWLAADVLPSAGEWAKYLAGKLWESIKSLFTNWMNYPAIAAVALAAFIWGHGKATERVDAAMKKLEQENIGLASRARTAEAALVIADSAARRAGEEVQRLRLRLENPPAPEQPVAPAPKKPKLRPAKISP